MSKIVQLKDIAKLNMGQSPKSEFYTVNNEDTPFLQGNRTFGHKYPYIDTYCSKPTKMATKGNVLMSVRAPVGHLNVAPCNLCIGRGVAEIQSLTNEPEYLYYVLLANQYRLDKGGNGTIFNSIGRDELNNLKLKVPEEKHKERFVDTLKTIDDKIEINYNNVKIINEYIQIMYHKWFVDFNFPNEKGNPYKKSNGEFEEIDGKFIPKNWRFIKLNEITDKVTQTIDPQIYPKTVYKHYSIPVYDESKTYAEELGETILSSKYVVTNNNLLVSKLNPWFKRIIYPMNSSENMICSTEFVVWKPINENILEYLYVIANTSRFTNYCTNASSGTSNSHKRVNPDYMMKFKVPYNEEVVLSFNELIKPMVKKLNLLLFENKNLKEIRNLLIKKLID